MTKAGCLGWRDARTVRLRGLEVTLSEPILIGRSKGYLWFPTMARLSNGDLVAGMSTEPDESTDKPTSRRLWSTDGGLSWGHLQDSPFGSDSSITLDSGDQLFLPYNLSPLPGGGMKGPYAICRRGEHSLRIFPEGLTVTGWPMPDHSDAADKDLSGFVFDGQALRLKGGKLLATLYGCFVGQKRYSSVAAESADGLQWTIRGIIAGHGCALAGREGPCEPATCRLADGRLMSVFRMGAVDTPYGKGYSSDEGRTWTDPAPVVGALSVQPSLAVLEGGTVVLSGGRPGVSLWFDLAGEGEDWQKVEVLPPEAPPEAWREIMIQNRGDVLRTSSYTEVVALDEGTVLLIHDRLPNGWFRIPPESQETNSVWVIRATVRRR
jgi:hypothetical protein